MHVFMRRRSAFTLVEILIAISIIAILILVPFFAFSRVLAESRDNDRKDKANQIQAALEQYKADNGVYPNALDELVEEGYMAAVPDDPFEGRIVPGSNDALRYDFESNYLPFNDNQDYSLIVPLEQEGNEGGSSSSGSYTIYTPNGPKPGGPIPSDGIIATTTPRPPSTGIPTSVYTLTPTNTPTETQTPTPTNTPTITHSPTPSNTPTITPSNVPSPTNTSIPNGYSYIGSGGSFSCGLTFVGGVKCWGEGSDGQLGNGSNNDSLTPVFVTGLSSGVSVLSVGNNHACVVTTAGGAKCWGYSYNGSLGNGTDGVSSNTPVDVTGLTSGVASISAGYGHTCAVTTSGGAKCWGSNYYGNLGNGVTTKSLTPVNVTGLTSGVASISAGVNHTCAVTTTGGAKCWGYNGFGGLGNGTFDQSLVPVNVSGLTTGTASISAAYDYTCAVTTGGGAKCWGVNSNGKLGYGASGSYPPPGDVTGLTSGVASISGGMQHTCAVTTGGGVTCWGDNWYGTLGNGNNSNSTTPVNVTGMTSNSAKVSSGGEHTCAVTTGGSGRCWGSNANAEFGNGNTSSSNTPVNVTAP